MVLSRLARLGTAARAVGHHHACLCDSHFALRVLSTSSGSRRQQWSFYGHGTVGNNFLAKLACLGLVMGMSVPLVDWDKLKQAVGHGTLAIRVSVMKCLSKIMKKLNLV